MWDTLKKILKKNTGACIIVEEGKPAFAVIPFDEYQKLLDSSVQPAKREGMSEQDLLEKINQEITDWKSRQTEENPEIELDEEPESDDLRIENLPLV